MSEAEEIANGLESMERDIVLSIADGGKWSGSIPPRAKSLFERPANEPLTFTLSPLGREVAALLKKA